MVSRVLAIEGSKAFRLVLKGLFTNAGMEVTILENSDALEDCLENTSFDFVCLGLHIPGSLDGLEVCRMLRDRPGYRYTPIVLLTSEAGQATQTEAFSSGFTDIFHRQELDDLDAYLKRHQEMSRSVEGRVLYIEDSVSQQMSMVVFLGHSGLTIDAFDNADEGWKAFQAQDYDIVLTDIVLPGTMSGLHLVHRIRRLEGPKGDTPILAITGYDDPSRRVELLQRGVNDYVSKPVVPQEVLVRVRTLLKNRYLVKQLQEQNQQIEAQSRNQLSFLASISHDVRTPLNGILGIMELIRSAKLDQQQLHWLQIAMQSGEHLVSIIDDVLDLSRAEVGEFVIEQQPVLPLQVLQNVASNLKPQADSKSIKLNVSVSASCPDVVEADGRRFYQVVTNLMSNAVKFTDNGAVDVHLDFIESADASADGMLIGTVVDTGVGIPDVLCDAVFQKFRQVDAVARSKGGSGLGLAIVRTIVESWGGSLGVESEVGKGSRFWFNLPVNVLENDPLMGEAHLETPSFKPEDLKILLVEDNRINQLVAGGLLAKLSLQHDLAEDGQQALDMLAQKDYNLILMDCQMPVMDGYEAAAYIRHSDQSFQHIYIIALTASAMITEERKCYRVGMNDFIAKPVQLDSLVKALNKAHGAIGA